jgi:hypothetical protein
MFSNGSTAIDGRSGTVTPGTGCSAATGAAAGGAVEGSRSSRTAPTKRMPLRCSVLMSRRASPLSPNAARAASMRLVSADSETMRPSQIAAIISSLLTTRSRLRIR